MEYNTREKYLLGFGSRLTFVVFMIAIAVTFLICGSVFSGVSAGDLDESGVLIVSIFFGIGVPSAILAALSFIGTVKGRTCKWGNNLVIGVSAVFCLALFGIFGVVGGVRGNKVIDRPELDEKKKKAPGYGMRLLFGILLLIAGLILILFVRPVGEYERPIFLCVSLACLALGILEIVCASVGKKKEWANDFSIAVGALFSVAAIGLFALYGGLLGREALVKVKEEKKACLTETQADRAEFHGQKAASYDTSDISLKIISIPDKEWKEYRNQASQDELFVLGIGMKLWLGTTRKSALFFTLGLLSSVVIGIILAAFVNAVVGIIVLAAGYLIFCTLCMRRHFIKTSLNQTKSKLNAENKKALDAKFKTSGGATVAEAFITIMLCTVCEPYAMILALASALIPSLLNTKLVIPEGFGFERLEEVKRYYAEKSFFSEAIEDMIEYNIEDSRRVNEEVKKRKRAEEASSSSPTDEYYREDEYTYVDGHGSEQMIYTDRNGKEARDAGGHFVGTIDGEGGDKKFTPAGTPPKSDDVE